MCAKDSVFQYRIGEGKDEVFLWLPADSERIRGLVIVGMTLAERHLSEDQEVRLICESEDLGIIFSRRGLAKLDIPATLASLAGLSGYAELEGAPMFFFGHSAGGPQARDRAAALWPHCFGLVQYRGGDPSGGTDDGMAVGSGVPTLMMVGQFDEFGGVMRTKEGVEPTWNRSVTALEKQRTADSENLAGLAVEPGAGHFAWSERSARLFSLFLEKAARARIPEDFPDNPAEPAVCREIDPESGWLVDPRLGAVDRSEAAPVADYTGDPQKAAWVFDEEMAKSVEEYQAGLIAENDQFIDWKNAYVVDAGVRCFFRKIDWIGDGTEFSVKPHYRDTYPGPIERGPVWSKAGEPVGHSEVPIQLSVAGGPLEVASGSSFRVRFSALAPADNPGRSMFLAFSEGDENFRYTEKIGMMPRGFVGLVGGAEQVINFPDLEDVKVDSKPVELHATSSSGLPVNYYVSRGPAVIKDGELRLAEVPERAKFPIEVEVVAWQFGSGKTPKVKTAVPVKRVFRIWGE